MDQQVFSQLLEKYVAGTSNKEEQVLLGQLLNEPANRAFVENLLEKEWKEGKYEETPEERIRTLIETKVFHQINEGKQHKPRIAMLLRIAAAAVLAAAVLMGALYVFDNKEKAAAGTALQELSQNDIPPAAEKTILELSDGTRLTLDSINGLVSRQGNTTVLNTAGALTYNAGRDTDKKPIYNTIFTGKGNRYLLVLPDGSKVWLNAASSLRFPAAFHGKERVVELRGEGYFEIVADKSKPFHVRYGKMEVEVLGTHFNIKAYNGESAWETTLLEGSVKAKGSGNPVVLIPGQQLSVNRTDGAERLRMVNTEGTIAWKENRFHFSNAPIETVMRELARWYDITVIYKERTNQLFNGSISRKEPISKILKLLALTEQVTFRIDGSTVTVAQ